MNIKEANDGLFKFHIDLGSIEGYEKLKGAWIELREPNEKEQFSFSKDSDENVKILRKLWPECVVGHNFTVGEGTEEKDCEVKEVVEFLKKSSGLIIEIITRWQDSLPLTKRTGLNSDNSQSTTLTENESQESIETQPKSGSTH